MSRFRWPIEFGLLNNDCLWVMDEVQLMGNGLATTAQLQAFRRIWGTYGPAKSIWMSATMRPEWLETVDFWPDTDAPGNISLNSDDYSVPAVIQRTKATKEITMVKIKKSDGGQAEAQLALKSHKPGSITLVIVNT
ncbi:MAG: CRISPR-associated helicase/endonuclease Cas3, partial [Deltaproteobacteria bacterium]|nr:CRISPR-associated helicase/endonuclease Cas3 [Deltaproteobacteria bacterium]